MCSTGMGDYNGDGRLTFNDVFFLVRLIYQSNDKPELDYNGDVHTNIVDMVALILDILHGKI